MVLATAKPTLDVEMAVARTASPRVTDVVPILQLPPFRALLTDEEDNHLDIDNGSATSDECTKKSFDSTRELKKLNESGASERRSFVEHSAIQPKWISVMTSVVTFELRFHPCPASLWIYAWQLTPTAALVHLRSRQSISLPPSRNSLTCEDQV